jgi:PA14 domain
MASCELPLRCRARAQASPVQARIPASTRGALVCALASVIVLACPASVLAGGFTGSNVVQPAIDTNVAGRAEAFSQTASASGTIDRLSFYLDGTSTASQVAVGLYSDASLSPGRRLGRCTVTRPRAGGWSSCGLAAVSITSGRRYWAAILQPTSSTGTIKFRDVLSVGAPSYTSTSDSLGSLPRTYRAGQGGSSSPASIYADLTPIPSPTPDTTPPDTSITIGPSGTTQATDASFQFTSSEANSSFECRLDAAAFAVCASPRNYAGLSVGQHTFDVRARDAAGNFDPTPASRTWTIEAPPPPPPPPATCRDGEYLARYWQNQTLGGLPALSRCEARVDNNFGSGGPPGLPTDGFSARYDGRISFAAGAYEFALGGDDGIRLWVDGSLVIDRWVNQAYTTYRATRTMTAGLHDIRVEYYEASGLAQVRLEITGAAPPPPPPSPPGEVALTQVDGGLGYYGQFSNPLPTTPDFFPIGVWGSYNHDAANIARDKAVGLNTYVWFADADQAGRLANARNAGMFAVVDRTADGGSAGSETFARMLADEIDMTQGPAACTGSLQQIKNSLPADGRMRYANYGKGVLLWETEAEAGCFVNAQELASTDLYWFTDPNQRNMIGESWMPEGERQLTRSQVERASNYGYQVDYMRKLDARDGKRQPIWNFVEVACPWNECGGDPDFITPAEIRAAVWHSIIAGARGIIYFQHTFAGPSGCVTHHALREPLACYSQVQAAVTNLDAQVKSLAPVLNAATVSSGSSTSSSIRAMVKWHAGNLYVFAGSRNNTSSTGTVNIPCVGNATAVRLGESGSVPVTNGSFSDQFADGNAIHIYRIDGGASCGLL